MIINVTVASEAIVAAKLTSTSILIAYSDSSNNYGKAIVLTITRSPTGYALSAQMPDANNIQKIPYISY